MSLRRPACTIIAGPNGGGKSTLFETIGSPGEFINADEIAKAISPLHPEKASIKAGRTVIRRLDDAFASLADFTYETTLSSKQSLEVLNRAKRLGYETLLVFVVLDSSDLHVSRVRQRVLSGGHRIAEEVIRRRYDRSFENLAEAVPSCDSVLLFDNSSSTGPQLLFHFQSLSIVTNRLDRRRALDRRLGRAVAAGLKVPRSHILS